MGEKNWDQEQLGAGTREQDTGHQARAGSKQTL